jgi:hypothetical protein
MALALLCSHLEKPDQPQTRPAERKKWEWNWKTERPMRKRIKTRRRNSESKKLLEDPTWPGLKFRAFVVDHDVRPGSDVEAKAVAEVLEARGKFGSPSVKIKAHPLFRYSHRNLED